MLRPLLIIFICFGFIAAGLHAAELRAGSILCQYWREAPGSKVADLTNLPGYPNLPDEQVLLDRLEIPENQEGEFGTVIRGFIHPPMDGTYTFYIASTNEGQLWLGDGNIVAELPTRMVASVPEWCAPRDWSACTTKPVTLRKGVPYYIEARHKNGGGDNHLAVAWKLPDGTVEGPIPGSRLSPGQRAIIPPTRAGLMDALPTAPGGHRVRFRIDHLADRFELAVNIVLPETYRLGMSCPGVVYVPDPDVPLDLLAAMPATWRNEQRVIVITPELPADRSYEQRSTRAGVAAAIKSLRSSLNLDSKHVGLTGPGGGATAAWRVAIEMPGTFSGFAPINGLQVEDRRLKEALSKTSVWIYTDIDEGFATGRANEMLAAIEGNEPKPEIVYLGQAELTGRPAPEVLFARADFYERLLSLQRSPTEAVAALPLVWIAMAAAGTIAVAYLLWRTLRR